MSVGGIAQLGRSLLSLLDGGSAGKASTDDSAFAAMLAGAASPSSGVTTATSVANAATITATAGDAKGTTPIASSADIAGATDSIADATEAGATVSPPVRPTSPIGVSAPNDHVRGRGMRPHGKHQPDPTDDDDPTAVMPATAPDPASLVAMLAVASTPIAIDTTASDGGDGPTAASSAPVVTAPTAGQVSDTPDTTDATDISGPSASSAMPDAAPTDPSLAPVLAALADSVAATAGAAPAPVPVSVETAVPPPSAAPAPAPQDASPQPSTAALMTARHIMTTAPAAPFATPTPQAATTDAPVATSSASIAQTASVQTMPASAPATASIQAAAQTASLVAPRSDPRGGSSVGRKAANDTDSEASATDAATSDPASALPPTLIAPHQAHVAARDGIAADPAASQLAAGGANRQLDLAKQGAWLDGLSRDIAATGDGSTPLRFAVAPQHLGSVQVEMLRDAAGSSVTLTASSDAARAALADARPQLVADARAQGIRIASAQVDVGTQSGDSRSSSQQHGESRSSSAAAGQFSAQANTQGDPGRGSQTRSQLLPINHVRLDRTTDAATGSAPTPPVAPSDGLYA